MKARHFLSVADLTADELRAVLDLAEAPAPRRSLEGSGVALLFEKPSNRTRNSAEMAVVQLGGHPVYIRGDEVGLDVRETTEDVARTLACYHAAIAARVFDHRTLGRMAAVVDVPVVNLLSDAGHPCQALADVLTMRQQWGGLDGRVVAWVGDWNNVARSLREACGLLGMEFRLGAPDGFGAPDLASVVPADAVRGANAVVTDVWTSMGQEEQAAARRAAFAGYGVDEALMAKAAPDALFLHCLPAHRGEEVTAAVVDGAQSVVWQEAVNRMHAMRGLLSFLFGGA